MAAKKRRRPRRPSRFLPKNKTKRRFSTGLLSGQATATYPNATAAAHALKAVRDAIAFAQVTARFTVTRSDNSKTDRQGFSKRITANQVRKLGVKKLAALIQRKTGEAAVNAAKQIGFLFSYEGGKPSRVKRAGRGKKERADVTLVLWFYAESRPALESF